MRRFTTVLIDVGGVLLLPSSELMRAALRPARFNVDDSLLTRAHYAATAAMDAHGKLHRELYRRTFARACGVPPDLEDLVVTTIAQTVTEYDWTRAVPGAQADLRRLLADGLRVGIVSNSAGTVADMLIGAGICQVGVGCLPAVEVVVDSGCVGVEKPDPRIFHIALAALGVDAAAAVYVGDTARSDVDGARQAGVEPIHLDPFQDCPDAPGDHRHIRRLGDVGSLLDNEHTA